MKRVLIIGAGFLQAYVIRKAHEMGYYVLAVDADCNAPGFAYADKHEVINIVDREACLAFARKERIDGVLTAATDYGVLTASHIARQLNLPGIDYEVAELIKNKYATRLRLSQNQVDDTGVPHIVTAETDIAALGAALTYPVMVKPCDGSGSRGASRVDNAAQLAEACDFAINSSLSHKATIETFIFGREYGIESLVVDNEVHIMGVMQKWMTRPPYYAELGHAIPNDLPDEIDQKVRRCVVKAIRTLGINFGAVNMDVLITPAGNVHIVDIGARMGGNLIGSHIIPIGTGIDYMGAMIANAVGDAVVTEPTAKPISVATKLLALTPGKVVALPDMKEIERQYDVTIEHHLAVGDTIREYHTNLDGCGYVIATGTDSVDTAAQALVAIDQSIIRQ